MISEGAGLQPSAVLRGRPKYARRQNRNDKGEDKVTWNFREGWPTKWTGPSFNATGNEVAIETLEIAHEGVVKA